MSGYSVTCCVVHNGALAQQAESAARMQNARLRNWEPPEPSYAICKLGSYRTSASRYKPKVIKLRSGGLRRVAFEKRTYTPVYTSVAHGVADDPRKLDYTFGFSGNIKTRTLRIQKLERENGQNLEQAGRLAHYVQFLHRVVKEAEGLVRSSLPAATKVDMLAKRLEEVCDALKRRTPLPEVKNELNPDDKPADRA